MNGLFLRFAAVACLPFIRRRSPTSSNDVGRGQRGYNADLLRISHCLEMRRVPLVPGNECEILVTMIA